jgi:hypothetical protein
MLAVARDLAPAEPLSETARSHTLAMALRELRRPATESQPADDAGTRDGLDALAPHTAMVTTPDGVEVVMADLEGIPPERAAEIADRAAKLIAQVAAAEERT